MQRQLGLSFGGLLVLLAIVGFCVYTVFRLEPAYMDYWLVKKSLEAVANDPQNVKASDGEIMLHLAKELEVNNVRVIKAGDVELERVQEGIKLSVDMSTKTPYFGSVSLATELHAEGITH